VDLMTSCGVSGDGKAREGTRRHKRRDQATLEAVGAWRLAFSGPFAHMATVGLTIIGG
jgi:hypothetical protein